MYYGAVKTSNFLFEVTIGLQEILQEYIPGGPMHPMHSSPSLTHC